MESEPFSLLYPLGGLPSITGVVPGSYPSSLSVLGLKMTCNLIRWILNPGCNFTPGPLPSLRQTCSWKPHDGPETPLNLTLHLMLRTTLPRSPAPVSTIPHLCRQSRQKQPCQEEWRLPASSGRAGTWASCQRQP